MAFPYRLLEKFPTPADSQDFLGSPWQEKFAIFQMRARTLDPGFLRIKREGDAPLQV
jgi:hypothetical protein